MAFNNMQSAIKNNLLLSGRDKKVIDSIIIDDVVRIGKEAFWRAHDWTFARKLGTLSLTANNTTGIDAPSDAETIIGLNRLTSSDDGFPIRLINEHLFDMRFPNLAEVSPQDTFFAKVTSSQGNKKIYFAPPSAQACSIGVLYKMKYTAQLFDTVVPEDYEPHVLACCLYYAMPAGSPERPSMFAEYQTMIRDAKRRDRVQASHSSDSGFMDFEPISRSNWRFFMDGNDYHGMG